MLEDAGVKLRCSFRLIVEPQTGSNLPLQLAHAFVPLFFAFAFCLVPFAFAALGGGLSCNRYASFIQSVTGGSISSRCVIFNRWARLTRDDSTTFLICRPFTTRPRKIQNSRKLRRGFTRKWQALRENMIEWCDA